MMKLEAPNCSVQSFVASVACQGREHNGAKSTSNFCSLCYSAEAQHFLSSKNFTMYIHWLDFHLWSTKSMKKKLK